MFEMYPELSDADALDAETRAFMAGYITHLVLDEVYVANMGPNYLAMIEAYGRDVLPALR